MMQSLSKSAEAYYDIYRNGTLLVKVSGKELQDSGFEKLAADIRDLTTQGIRILLTFCGGEQINKKWRSLHDSPRPMRNGMGITSASVLRDAVIPAYNSIRAWLTHAIPGIGFVEPEQIICSQQTDLGY